MPPTFMSVNVAARQLLESIKVLEGATEGLLGEHHRCVALARVGSDSQRILSCSLSQMLEVDLGPPLHSLIVVGQLHPIESEMLKLFQ